MFKASNIKIDESGIDLIKNYSVSKHIDYRDIESIEVRKGHFIKNRLLALSIGLIVSAAGILWGISLIEKFDLNTDVGSGKSYPAAVFSSLILVIAGILMIIQSFRKCKNLTMTIGNKNYNVPLDQFEKDNKISDLSRYLKSKVRIMK